MMATAATGSVKWVDCDWDRINDRDCCYWECKMGRLWLRPHQWSWLLLLGVWKGKIVGPTTWRVKRSMNSIFKHSFMRVLFSLDCKLNHSELVVPTTSLSRSLYSRTHTHTQLHTHTEYLIHLKSILLQICVHTVQLQRHTHNTIMLYDQYVRT